MRITIMLLVMVLYVILQINLTDFNYFQRTFNKFELSLTLSTQIAIYIRLKWAYETHPHSQLHQDDFTLACVLLCYDYIHLQHKTEFRAENYQYARWELMTIIKLLARKKPILEQK